MKSVHKNILEQVIAATAEPLVVVRIDQPDWPVVLSNPAFATLAEDDMTRRPFADVIEKLAGREVAMAVSKTVRSQLETTFPIESNGREYLLVLKPLSLPDEEVTRFYVAYWRLGAGVGSAGDVELHQALLKAKRRIGDLSRDDPVTGLLNARAFEEVFEHDWAVAARDNSKLSVVAFTLDEFDAYTGVFGRHAADSCLRKVGQAIRRCLRRASDVAARTRMPTALLSCHMQRMKTVCANLPAAFQPQYANSACITRARRCRSSLPSRSTCRSQMSVKKSVTRGNFSPDYSPS
ncbi:MAG: diguanylate cyclase [Proteobacteria bacterium]|nr:diguanylate cyclase [Pseudomonadota bacterium]